MIYFCTAFIVYTIASTAIVLLLKSHQWFLELYLYFKPVDNLFSSNYDFIVVGGGTAGSLLASRLAEDERYQVLLLEAGSDSSFLHDIPLLTPMLQESDCDWQHRTVPQKHACQSLAAHVSKWPMGKIMGGSSRLNFNIYLRGHEKDFQSWSPANSSEWDYEDLLYYFKKSENQIGRYKNSELHGKQGPIFVSDLPYATKFSLGLLDAAKELGYKLLDINEYGHGFMEAQVTMAKGARWSSEKCLREKPNRLKNLHVFTNAFVEKVLIRDNIEAYGVQFKYLGSTLKVFVKKSVILSAGAIGSPKILMLSGIGPKNHLKNLKIPVVADLPVGRNLQDHVLTGLDMVILEKSVGIDLLNLINPLHIFNYFINGKGLWTAPGCETVGVVYSNESIDQTTYPPDLQFMSIPAGVSSDAGVMVRKIMSFSEELWQYYLKPLTTQYVTSVCPVLLHPKSKGYVELKSADPADSLTIDPQYLSHSDDVNVLVKGMKIVEKFVNTQSLRESFGAKLNTNKVPGCENYDFGSDSYWKCYVRHVTLTSYHPIGTCRMGTTNAVVDHSLKVKGVNSLFVADASIMPTLPSANTNAAVMAIAEKAADILKSYWYSHFQLCKISDIFLPAPKFTRILI